MPIKIAQSAGFCFGVKRAVDMAEKAAQKHGTLYAYGEIIHNRHEIVRLQNLGVITCHALAEIPPQSPVLIRAHGIGKAETEALENQGCTVYNATCPYVQKIHKIVQAEHAKGRKIIILGSENHPEVIGIAGWCQDAIICENDGALQNLEKNPCLSAQTAVSVVGQTTLNLDIWNKSVKILKKRYTNAKIFDTICNATDERQQEARHLAGESDAMIVIGDQNSSNTKRLFEISRGCCPCVLLIEDASELTTETVGRYQGLHVGITAGASTPDRIIKEVSNNMMNEETFEMEDFAAMLEESFKTLNNGDKVTGTVIAVTGMDIQVDLGVKHTAYIPLSELSDDPSYDVHANVKAGDDIEAVVVRVNDMEGTITLSKKRVDQLKGWEIIEAAKDAHEAVEGLIIEENRGGVVAVASGIRIFIPASQTGVPKEESMSRLLKTKASFYVTEINRQRRRVVGSIREVLREQRKIVAEKVWETIEIGNEYDGTVKSLTSYGAFVDIGGVDGMIHISELSWGRVKHPSEVVAIGDAVKVFVIGLDKENKKISLGYKRSEDNPWVVFTTQYQVGSVAEVKILKFMPFGAFAEIMPGVDGLIHISQIADHRIAKAEEALTIGQIVEAKIIDINDEKKKVSLSIRALLDEGDDEEVAEEAAAE